MTDIRWGQLTYPEEGEDKSQEEKQEENPPVQAQVPQQSLA